jgi:two-component system, NarL family, sensor kinase
MVAGETTAATRRGNSTNHVPDWIQLTEASAAGGRRPRTPTVGQVVGRFLLANLVTAVLLLAGGVWASVHAAEEEALADARRTTDLLATVLIQPNVEAGLPDGDPAAVAALDAAITGRLAETDVIRVKIWSPDGVIVYSDEERLIGADYGLDDDDREALRDGITRAEVSDLGRPENRFERSFGRLLEVYRQIEGPGGQELLLETYSIYAEATSRRMEIGWHFVPIIIAVLVTLVAVQLPLAYRMVTQLRMVQREREDLQARALDVSTEERRQIAGSLHDGIVQDVSAAALLVGGAADRLRGDPGEVGTRTAADALTQAAAGLRESVGSLRALLVEIHPPTLANSGLPMALADLAARLRPRGVDVRLNVAEHLDPPPATTAVVLRTAQEALRNVVKHSGARVVEVTVEEGPGRLVLSITDDGVGFDVDAALHGSRDGHMGLRLLTDLATTAGAVLRVRTAPGAGTSLRLEVPTA